MQDARLVNQELSLEQELDCELLLLIPAASALTVSFWSSSPLDHTWFSKLLNLFKRSHMVQQITNCFEKIRRGSANY